MHAGSDQPTAEDPFPDSTNVRFTNIMADVVTNPDNLFDTSFDDRGRCTERVISTYNSTWEQIFLDGQGDPRTPGSQPFLQDLGSGTCMSGDGHHFCSSNREGARFSNGGGGTCTGSEADSIYWAWDADQHGCNNALRIGTGCARRHSSRVAFGLSDNGEALPTFRYNFLLVH